MSPEDEKNIPENFEGDLLIPRNIDHLIELFTSAQLAIGERLHFLVIASQLTGPENTYTLRKPYSEKVESFCQKYKISPHKEPLTTNY